MKALFKFVIIGLTVMTMLGVESCTGCSHRHRRQRDRNRERTERIDRDEETSESQRKRGGKDHNENWVKYSEEDLQALANSEDYDAMLDAMFSQLQNLKKLKKEYFKGRMSDKEAQSRIEDINKAYSPIDDKLSEASSEGLLNYNQHQRQMKLVGEYIKLVNDVMTKVGTDLTNQLR